jgi:Transcriptional repressor TCF25
MLTNNISFVEHAQAVSFVERALYTYERSFVGAFSFTTGLNRLDFLSRDSPSGNVCKSISPNPVFSSLSSSSSDLQRRGCFRTAFEFARLLYSLDPWNDPFGAVFHLDYLSVRTGMHQWLLDVFDHFAGLRERGIHHKARLDPSLLPGWVYSRALALRMNKVKRRLLDSNSCAHT